MSNEETILSVLLGFLALSALKTYSQNLTPVEIILSIILIAAFAILIEIQCWKHFSKSGKEIKKRKENIKEIPDDLKLQGMTSVYMGIETELNIPIYLPDHIRSRHVHILGATGSGKTESVVLNFLNQDIKRDLGAIILDAKGDQSFTEYLKNKVPLERLYIFDLSDHNSIGYNPLLQGSPLESAQRLFSSMIWSEEYYKSKALSVLQTVFQYHFERQRKNPTLSQIKLYLGTRNMLSEVLGLNSKEVNIQKEYDDLSGLRDQIRSLCVGHLENLLSPSDEGIDLTQALNGKILYFRLQSLLSPQAVQILGKLIIQNISFLAGQAHRDGSKDAKLVPIYLDEFASFASPEFADLISKARSAKFALHFSHQSIGDVEEVSKGFINRITDNSATKIILRINDPDSADFFARSFGTRLYQKFTQKVANSSEETSAELVGEGTSREAHQFRSSPDIFKTLPTGTGSVLIAHGYKTKEGGSHVFNIKFPRLN